MLTTFVALWKYENVNSRLERRATRALRNSTCSGNVQIETENNLIQNRESHCNSRLGRRVRDAVHAHANTHADGALPNRSRRRSATERESPAFIRSWRRVARRRRMSEHAIPYMPIVRLAWSSACDPLGIELYIQFAFCLACAWKSSGGCCRSGRVFGSQCPCVVTYDIRERLGKPGRTGERCVRAVTRPYERSNTTHICLCSSHLHPHPILRADPFDITQNHSHKSHTTNRLPLNFSLFSFLCYFPVGWTLISSPIISLNLPSIHFTSIQAVAHTHRRCRIGTRTGTSTPQSAVGSSGFPAPSTVSERMRRIAFHVAHAHRKRECVIR